MTDAKKDVRIIGRWDVILIASLLALGLLAAILLPLALPSGRAVSVELNGKQLAEYPLDVDARIELGDGSWSNLLVIEDGTAFFERADCPDGGCIARAPISREGETIICLPHRLVIRITDGSSLSEGR